MENSDQDISKKAKRFFIQFLIGGIASILYLAFAQFIDSGGLELAELILDPRHLLIGLFVAVFDLALNRLKT